MNETNYKEDYIKNINKNEVNMTDNLNNENSKKTKTNNDKNVLNNNESDIEAKIKNENNFIENVKNDINNEINLNDINAKIHKKNNFNVYEELKKENKNINENNEHVNKNDDHINVNDDNINKNYEHINKNDEHVNKNDEHVNKNEEINKKKENKEIIKEREKHEKKSKEKMKYKSDSSSNEKTHSYKRRRSYKSRSREKMKSRYKKRNRNRNFSNTSSEERYYYKKKKRKKRNSYYSDESSSSTSRNKSISSSIEENIIDTKPKKKSKWDTIDANLIKGNVLDNTINKMLPKQNITNNLIQNNRYFQLNKNPYEMDSDKKQRKLYIGNIPPDCKQENIIEFFNNTLLSLTKNTSLEVKVGDITLLPIVKCEIFNIDSRFCFLEFRTQELTWLSLKMDGICFNNYFLRIGRPHDYVLPPDGDPAFNVIFSDINMNEIEKLKGNKNSQSKTNDDEYKMYIQNLPHDLKDEQIKDLLEQFGKLKSFNIIKDLNTGLNKGYGFFEYEDSTCAQVAIHALNGFVCGHNILNVKKANTKNHQNNQNLNNPNNINIDKPVSILPNSVSYQILSNSIIGLQIQASRKIGEKPSKVVQLTNAVFQEDLIIQNQYDEILKEIKEEAEKYGPLNNIIIPKPNKDLSFTEGVGKVFLYYVDETTARKAQYMFNGRLFENRVVCAAFYPEDKFLIGKYVLS